MTMWTFVLPSTCLYKNVSRSTYNALFAVQIMQGTLILMSQCACDSFFFSLTMHLCGQLELLRMRFVEITRKHNDHEKYRSNALGPLVERHCHLITLVKNVDDAFNANILLRLLIISVVIAVSGTYHKYGHFIHLRLEYLCNWIICSSNTYNWSNYAYDFKKYNTKQERWMLQSVIKYRSIWTMRARLAILTRYSNIEHDLIKSDTSTIQRIETFRDGPHLIV